MHDTRILAAMLAISVGLSAYLLVILNSHLKPIYGDIWGWRLIFAGYVFMFVEVLVGLVLVMSWLPLYVRFFNLGFCALMLIKIICYVIGFRLWAAERRSLLDPKRWFRSQGDDK